MEAPCAHPGDALSMLCSVVVIAGGSVTGTWHSPYAGGNWCHSFLPLQVCLGVLAGGVVLSSLFSLKTGDSYSGSVGTRLMGMVPCWGGQRVVLGLAGAAEVAGWGT